MAQTVKNLPAIKTWVAMKKTWVQSLGWEDPLEKGLATHSVFLPGEFHGLYGPWGLKESDTDMTEQLSLSLHYMGRVLGNPKQLQHACLVACSVMSDCDPFDCRPPGPVLSVLRIFQARILERVAIFFSRGSS